MTQNQLRAAELAELRRSNLEKEKTARWQALSAEKQAAAAESRAQTEGTGMIWKGVLGTLGFVLPSADAIIGAAAKVASAAI